MRIDLDQNATTPLDPEAREAMAAALTSLHGNPSSLHAAGRRAREAVEGAREAVAQLIGACPEDIIFTSGGTEANNLAIAGTLARIGGWLAVSQIEHPSVLHCAANSRERGFPVTEVPPDPDGVVRVEAFVDGGGPGPALVSLMTANNETGCIQPVAALGRAARERDWLVHTDAVQAIGKIPIDVRELGADLLTMSAHKIGGPKGVGALWARPGARPRPLFHGGGQENGVRPGTENVAGIVGFGAAARVAARRGRAEAESAARLRDTLEARVTRRVPAAVALGAGTLRVPNTSFIAFDGIEGTTLVQRLDLMGVACSTGAACEARSSTGSHVLEAMGIDRRLARGGVRFSLGFGTTIDEIEAAVERIATAVEEIGWGERSPRVPVRRSR